MKANLSQIKKIYEDMASSGALAAAGSCPEPETIVRCVRSELPRKQRSEVLDHISRCASCAREAKLLLDTSAGEDRLVQEIKKTGWPARDPRAEGQESWLVRLSRNPVAAAAAVIVAAAALFWTFFLRPSRINVRRGSASSVSLLAPANASLSKTELKFTWREVANARAYVLEVFDASLDLLWRSEPLSAPEALPPAEVRLKLKPGEEYHWMVTASLPGGSRVKSGLERFRIAEK
jgi:hypothetical protein